MDLAEAEEMLAASKRYPELVTMLCPPPFGLRGDLMVKKILAENYIGQPHQVRLQSFHGNYSTRTRRRIGAKRSRLVDSTRSPWGFTLRFCSAGLATSPVCSRAEKSVSHFREAYNVIVPDSLMVLCSFESGAEGVLEFSGVNALAEGDRLEIYGNAGTLTYDFTADVLQTGKVGDRALHVVDVPTELEGEWRVEEDFSQR